MAGKNDILGRNRILVPILSTTEPRKCTNVSALGHRRLTAWAMAKHCSLWMVFYLWIW